MKPTEFKKAIKSAVKEAIREELKDILFEAFKSQTSTPTITENKSYTPPQQDKGMTLENKREQYAQALGQTELNFNSTNVAVPFTPQQGMGGPNGNLGHGNVSMDQISSLLKK